MSLTDILLPLLLMLAVSTVIESLLIPRPSAIWRRDWQAVVLFVLTLCCLFGLYIAITRRPWLSAALTAGLPALLTGVSNVKFNQLREPLLYTDWRYFWEMIRYPALYLPYFGTGWTVLLFVGFITLLVGWVWVEPPGFGVLQALSVGSGMALISGAISVCVVRQWEVLKRPLDPLINLRDWGGLATHWVYHKRLHENIALPEAPFIHVSRSEDPLPDLVCIQAESFVDRRRWGPDYPDVDHPMLSNWDRLREQSVRQGKLIVPAWGANTVRTEFAVLTGVDLKTIGTHRFDPYRSMLMSERLRGVIGLPKWLASHGYRSTFVHPYERTFYDRDRVIPQLGFDRFVDVTAFDQQDAVGQYISDRAVGHKIIHELEHPSPSFIYAVTMQGHGPYGAANLPADQMLANYDQCMLATDHMLGELQQRLIARDRPTVLCVFGDHVPSMPSVYARFGYPDNKTDYLIWHTDDVGRHFSQSPAQDVSADKLSFAVLQAAGFMSSVVR